MNSIFVHRDTYKYIVCVSISIHKNVTPEPEVHSLNANVILNFDQKPKMWKMKKTKSTISDFFFVS